MPDSPVTWLRRPGQPAYTDADALNDIVVLLTTVRDTDEALLGDIAAVIVRTGRAMARVRGIEACVTESPHGRPVAHVDAVGTFVTVRQEPDGAGLLVEITSTGQNDTPDEVTVLFDGRCLHHPCPPGGHAA